MTGQETYRDLGIVRVAGCLLLTLTVCSIHAVKAQDGSLFEPIKTVGLGSLGEVAVCPAGGCYLTASGNGLQLWTLGGDLISSPISGTSVHAEWSYDGTRIAATLGNGSHKVLSRDGEVLASTDAIPSGTGRWVGDDIVAMTISESKIRFWGLANASLLGEIDTPSNILGSSFSHNSKLIAITYGGQEKYLYIYDMRNWAVVERIPAESPALSMSWSRDDTKLAYAPYQEGNIYIWDVLAGKTIAEKQVPRSISRMAWSHDSSLLAVSSWNWVSIHNGTSLQHLISLGPTSPQTLFVSWVPDGSRLVTGSMDGWVSIWDVSTVESQTALWQEESGITRARYSHSGTLALGLANGTLRCLSGPSLDRVGFSADIKGSGAVSTLGWSDDSSMVAVGYKSGMVAIWSDKGGLQGAWTAHSGGVRDLGWAPGSDVVATVGDDGYLAFWDRMGNVLRKKEVGLEHSNQPVSLAWTPNGTMIATGYMEGSARVWSYPGLELLSSPLRYGSFTSLEWAPTTTQPGLDLLAGAGDSDGLVLVWEAWGRASFYEELEEHENEVTDLSWSPDGSVLATCSLDGCVRLWHLVKRDIYGYTSIGGLMETLAAGSELTSVDWSPDGSVLASSKTGILYRWDLEERLEWKMNNHTTSIQDIAWSPDSGSIAYNLGAQELGIYDLDSDAVDRHYLEGMPDVAQTFSMDWSNDGTRIAVGSMTGSIKVIDPSGKFLFTVTQEGDVKYVEWSPDSRYLASTCADRTIKIYDGYTGSLIMSLPGHTGVVTGLSWSQDGKWLASSSHDGSVKLWDISVGQLGSSYKLTEGYAEWVSWSPDMSSIAVIVFDTSVWKIVLYLIDVDGNIIWSRVMPAMASNIAWSPSGSQLAVPTYFSPEHKTIILSRSGTPLCNLTSGIWEILEWSPDGKYIASGGYDGVLKIYDAEPINQMPEFTTLNVLVGLPLLLLLLARSNKINSQRWSKTHLFFRRCI